MDALARKGVGVGRRSGHLNSPRFLSSSLISNTPRTLEKNAVNPSIKAARHVCSHGVRGSWQNPLPSLMRKLEEVLEVVGSHPDNS